jgi:hypothetical protein
MSEKFTSGGRFASANQSQPQRYWEVWLLALLAALLLLAIGSVFGVMNHWRHGSPWLTVRITIGPFLAIGMGGSYGPHRRRRKSPLE